MGDATENMSRSMKFRACTKVAKLRVSPALDSALIFCEHDASTAADYLLPKS